MWAWTREKQYFSQLPMRMIHYRNRVLTRFWLFTTALLADTVLITQLPLFESHAIFPSIEQVNRSEGIPNVRQMWPEARQSTL